MANELDALESENKALKAENERLHEALTEINNGLKSEHTHSDTTSHKLSAYVIYEDGKILAKGKLPNTRYEVLE